MNAGEVLRRFYEAVIKRDLATARKYLADDLEFVGLFETYRSADQYIAAPSGLLSITTKLDMKTVIGESDDAAIFFELQTRANGEATVLVAEWHRVKGGKIWHAESAFDARPYEAMFAGSETA